MARLIALNSDAHKALKHRASSAHLYAATSHMLPIRVTEVAQAIVDFPVLMSKTPNGDMALSILTSFELQKNLFLQEGKWGSSFQSTAMRTFPVFLMRPNAEETEPVLAIIEGHEALSDEDGDAFFDKRGKPSLHLKQLKAQLLEDSRNTVHTFQFFEKLNALNLIRAVDLVLNYADGQSNRITGLSMINEDVLQTLSPEALADLRDRGYLPPIYAILFSVFQLNALIRRHNASEGLSNIKNINLEVSKDSRPV